MLHTPLLPHIILVTLLTISTQSMQSYIKDHDTDNKTSKILILIFFKNLMTTQDEALLAEHP